MVQNQFNGIGLNEDLVGEDKILDYIGESDFLTYDIEFSAMELDARDPGADCEDYGPGYEFMILKDCYDMKVEKEFAYLGCTPPWFTDKEEKVCRPVNS